MTRPETWVLLVGLASAVGCGGKFDAFAEDSNAAHCAKFEECGYLDALGWSYEDCIDEGLRDDTGTSEASDFKCEDYDKDAAAACLDAIAAVSCEDYNLGKGTEICNAVCSND